MVTGLKSDYGKIHLRPKWTQLLHDSSYNSYSIFGARCINYIPGIRDELMSSNLPKAKWAKLWVRPLHTYDIDCNIVQIGEVLLGQRDKTGSVSLLFASIKSLRKWEAIPRQKHILRHASLLRRSTILFIVEHTWKFIMNGTNVRLWLASSIGQSNFTPHFVFKTSSITFHPFWFLISGDSGSFPAIKHRKSSPVSRATAMLQNEVKTSQSIRKCPVSLRMGDDRRVYVNLKPRLMWLFSDRMLAFN